MDLSVRMVLGETVAQKAEQLQHLLREPVIGIVMAAQSRGGGRIRAGRSSQSKIDAARRQCFEHAELFGDHQRRMVRLVNSVVTLPGDQRVDELESPEDATDWLIELGLVPQQTTLLRYCQNQLTGLRTHLRALFAARVEAKVPPQDALNEINRILTSIPSTPLLRHSETSGFYRQTEHPITQLVEHAMAQIADDAAGLLTGGQSVRIERCAASPCDRYLLVTHARRLWCSTRCGDRVRAARAYARKQMSAPVPQNVAPD